MLTYEDRYHILRETKIAHTVAKRKQDGTRDLDDFGTVPLPEGHRVNLLYTAKNGSFYGLRDMSENYSRLLDAHPAYVDPMELLCGRWRDMLVNYRGDVHYMPAWRKNDPKNAAFLESGATALWSYRWDEERFPYDDLKPLQQKYNISSGIDGDAHFACDYRIGFEKGFPGFLDMINKGRQTHPEKSKFWDAEEKVVLAILRFIDRHIAEIERLLATETRPEIKNSLQDMLTACKNVRSGKPKTFHDACQFTAFFNCAARIYTRDGAGFQLDELLYPYYKRDTEAGILDDDRARFLLANLFLIDPHYYQIAGPDAEGNDTTNRLSYLALEAAAAINISCNLTVRVHEKSDKELLRFAVSCLLQYKNGWPRFCNDDALVKGYMRCGADRKTARDRIAVGCNWMAVPGREFPMNDTVKINVAKVFEVAMEELKGSPAPSVDALFALYEKHLAIAVDTVARGVNHHIDHIADVTPELVMNLMMHHTMEEGEDISRSADLYTIGVDGAGLAVVADSFGALTTRVEEEGVLSWQEVFDALESNFADPRVHAILSSAPRYCQGNTVSDRWAVRLTESWERIVRAQKMPEGRQLLPGWFSWARSIEYGAAVGATPNGRRAHEPISHGANPCPHFRKDGAATAQSNGIASVQCHYGNTAPLQIEFDPHMANDETGVETVLSFILGHFRQGGTLININILDKDTLLEAHADPASHPDLVVRVTGFTAYFLSLSPEFRQLVVDRFLEGL